MSKSSQIHILCVKALRGYHTKHENKKLNYELFNVYLFGYAYDIHNTNSWHFWCQEFAAMLFQWSHAHCQHFSSQFYHSTTLFIAQFYVQFCVATGLAAVCFTICMIQCVFSILIYTFSHIFIKLPWIEDKQQQQHCFSIEGKSIVGIGYTLSIEVISSLVNFTIFIKIWESIQTGSIPTTGWVLSNLITFLLKLSILIYKPNTNWWWCISAEEKNWQYVSGNYIC